MALKCKCKTCKELMEIIGEDEGGLITCWCYKCGSLALGFEDDKGNVEVDKDSFYTVGVKPKLIPEDDDE